MINAGKPKVVEMAATGHSQLQINVGTNSLDNECLGRSEAERSLRVGQKTIRSQNAVNTIAWYTGDI
jgi:hypothetical protein